MKKLLDFKKDIHKCSKCGLCQAECPVYKVTGNDCTVSRGQFVMLNGIIKGDLKMNRTINRYLDICLKCGKCSKFCPSGIDVVDIIITAKSEYFMQHPLERVISLFQKYIIFGLIPRVTRTFVRPTKSKTYNKKVLYFGGCGSKFKGDKNLVEILNYIGLEVINPEFHCCGIPFFSRGDLNEYNNSIQNYIKILKKYDIKEVVTTCASCERSLKNYIKWVDNKDDKNFLSGIKVKNIYEYLHETGILLALKNTVEVTYHKPCNMDNYDDIKWLLENTKNLNYTEMQGYDECCGLNGVAKVKEYKTFLSIFSSKLKKIKKTKVKTVLTSCLGCEIALKFYSLGRYKVYDLIDFIGKKLLK